MTITRKTLFSGLLLLTVVSLFVSVQAMETGQKVRLNLEFVKDFSLTTPFDAIETKKMGGFGTNIVYGKTTVENLKKVVYTNVENQGGKNFERDYGLLVVRDESIKVLKKDPKDPLSKYSLRTVALFEDYALTKSDLEKGNSFTVYVIKRSEVESK